MNIYPILFNRRNYQGREGDQLGFIVMCISLQEETDICLGINAMTFMVDWGDGCSDHKNLHHYEQAGKYKVRIIGFSICLLDVSKCHVVELSLERCPWLEMLLCAHNHLKKLELPNYLDLVFLDCSDNELSEFRLSERNVLQRLDCSKNKLKLLDLSGCEALVYLYGSFNRLQHLDLSPCGQICSVDVGYNALELAGLHQLFDTLPDMKGRNAAIMMERNPGCSKDCNTDVLHQKGWCIY